MAKLHLAAYLYLTEQNLNGTFCFEMPTYSMWPLDRTKKTRTCISYHRRKVAN